MSDKNPQDLYTDYRDLWQSPEQQFRELVAQSDQGWSEATATEEAEAMAVFNTPEFNTSEPSINYASLWKQPGAGVGEGAGIMAGEGSLGTHPPLGLKLREHTAGDTTPSKGHSAGTWVIQQDGGII